MFYGHVFFSPPFTVSSRGIVVGRAFASILAASSDATVSVEFTFGYKQKMQPTGRKYFLHHHFSEFSADILLLLLLLSLLFPPAASLSSLVAIQAGKKENCIIERRRNRGKKTNKTRTWARTTWTRAHSTQHIRWWWMSISYRWSAQAIIDSWRPVLYRFVLVHRAIEPSWLEAICKRAVAKVIVFRWTLKIFAACSTNAGATNTYNRHRSGWKMAWANGSKLPINIIDGRKTDDRC